MSLRRSSRHVPPKEAPIESSDATTIIKAVKRKAIDKSKAVSKKRASAAMPPPPPPGQEASSAPKTPTKRRKLETADENSPSQPPSMIKTPTAIGEMMSYSTGDIDDALPTPPKARRRSRPAQPHMTNATLLTPRGSRVVPDTQTAEHALEITTSSQNERAGPDTTAENLLEKACAHLIKVDPKLKHVIEQHKCPIFSPEGLAEEVDPFRSLTSAICGQQVSGAAAQSIKNKFVALYNEGNEGRHIFPTPQQVAETDIPRLRSAGLSGRKAEYIQGLAEKFANGELTAKMLAEASDEEILEKLTAVRGLGKWSVEMFACFALKRTDILSTGDLGVQRGMAAYVGKDVGKLKAKGGGKWKYMSEQDMLDISAKFAPYRSLFMWYMWRIENVNVNAIQDTS